MKKIILFALTVFLLFAISACGIKPPASGGETTTGSNNDSSSQDDSSQNASSNDWTSFYDSYSEAMSQAYDNVEVILPEENFMYSMDMLRLINGDITLAFTSAFFSGSEEGVEIALSMFGHSDMDYSESGDTATLTGKNSDGENFEYELKYDKSSASAILTATSSGEKVEVISIHVDDNFYAKTYWSPESGNTRAISYTNGDFHMCWDDEPAAEGDHLYKNTDFAQDSDFGTGLAHFMSVEDGVVSGSSD